ncbi:hypothetical protein [Krasilnikovia sp. M28-CT-15]|uniref:hypothetical protein n=1 Tax=Krasilnikovia sp. M28-CT-15 TaxID=3373540 RepID=UPI003875C96B
MSSIPLRVTHTQRVLRMILVFAGLLFIFESCSLRFEAWPHTPGRDEIIRYSIIMAVIGCLLPALAAAWAWWERRPRWVVAMLAAPSVLMGLPAVAIGMAAGAVGLLLAGIAKFSRMCGNIGPPRVWVSPVDQGGLRGAAGHRECAWLTTIQS